MWDLVSSLRLQGLALGPCVVVVHIWSLQKLINHMWEGTLTDVGLGVKPAITRSSPWSTHIWLLQKLINHMWEGTLTDVGLGVKPAITRSSPWSR